MKTMLVTGASGFIGRHVVAEGLKRGMHVVAFDRVDHKLFADNPNVDVFVGDIRNFDSINEAVKHSDYAINLAGILGTQEMINDPIPAVESNIVGAINFFRACIPDQFHNVKAVQIAVGNWFMNNSYSISKSTAVRYAKMYNKEHNTKIAIVRALNAYGAHQLHKPVRKVIPSFINKALNGENIEVYGDGMQIMDMIWVEDLARILVDACVLDHGKYDDYEFEAGTGVETTVKWIAQQVNIACGRDADAIDYLPMRAGETKGSVVIGDPSTLAPLGKQELVMFDKKIHDVVYWYKNSKK